MAVNRSSNLRTISVTPARWRRSVQASQGDTVAALSEISEYPRMQALDTTGGNNVLEFYFPFPPSQVTYDQVSPELAEIQRPGKKPLVLFARDQSTRISFQFLIAVPKDGVFIDVEDSIDTLISIAQSTRPVIFWNIDKFLGAPSSTGSVEVKFWSIMDLSFESVRRNAAQRITSASARISLIENANPSIDIISLPEIEYTDNVPQQAQPSANVNDNDPPNFIDYITIDDRTGSTSLSIIQQQ